MDTGLLVRPRKRLLPKSPGEQEQELAVAGDDFAKTVVFRRRLLVEDLAGKSQIFLRYMLMHFLYRADLGNVRCFFRLVRQEHIIPGLERWVNEVDEQGGLLDKDGSPSEVSLLAAAVMGDLLHEDTIHREKEVPVERRLALVQELLKRKFSAVDSRMKRGGVEGMTPLMMICHRQFGPVLDETLHKSVVRQLLRRGADPFLTIEGVVVRKQYLPTMGVKPEAHRSAYELAKAYYPYLMDVLPELY